MYFTNSKFRFLSNLTTLFKIAHILIFSVTSTSSSSVIESLGKDLVLFQEDTLSTSVVKQENGTIEISTSLSFSNCGGIFVTPFHILTTSNCAILLKKRKLKPVSMQSMPNYPFSIVMKPQAQHFNVSEIYLHPSHTKRKHASNQNVQNQMSHIEDKDIALLKIASKKS